jgi:glutamate 5-kinase
MASKKNFIKELGSNTLKETNHISRGKIEEDIGMQIAALQDDYRFICSSGAIAA